METIETLDRVREIIGSPNPATYRKIKDRLTEQMSAFIARSPLLMLATVDEEGYPSVSPKGDAPGFVKVVDDRTLLVPERKGNKLAFTFDNLIARPRAGLIFLVPGTDETLRVQGRCTVVHDEALCRELASATQPALLAVRIEVSSCYFHCAKAFLRSRAWVPDAWGERMPVSFGKEIFGTGREAEQDACALDRAIQGRYVADL